MKRLSVLSITLMILGILLFGLHLIRDGYSELIVLFAYLSFLVGMILSFIAIAKREEGNLKFISLLLFFLVMFFVTWFEPFQVLRILTWIKNIF